MSYWLQNYTFWTSVILITELYLLNQCHTDYRITPSDTVRQLVHLVQSAPPSPPPHHPHLNQCHTDYRIIPSEPLSYWLQNYTFRPRSSISLPSSTRLRDHPSPTPGHWNQCHTPVCSRCPHLTELLVPAGVLLRRQKQVQQGLRLGLSPGGCQRCSAAADPAPDHTLHGLAHLEHVGDGASADCLQRTSEKEQ